MNNFSSGMAVLSALNNSSVQRLRNLWTAVRKEHRDLVNHFELFMGMTDNFKNYRYGAPSGPPHARHTSHRSYHTTQPAFSNNRRHLRKLQQATSDMTRANRKTPLIPFLGTLYQLPLADHLLTRGSGMSACTQRSFCGTSPSSATATPIPRTTKSTWRRSSCR